MTDNYMGYKGKGSPRAAKRFRILSDASIHPPAGACYLVLEGLERPTRRAYWRIVGWSKTEKAAMKLRSTVNMALGVAVVPPDAHDEIDFVDMGGGVLS